MKSINKEIELDLADINVKRAALSVAIEKPENKQAGVQINTSCGRGRQVLRHRKKYQIQL